MPAIRASRRRRAALRWTAVALAVGLIGSLLVSVLATMDTAPTPRGVGRDDATAHSIRQVDGGPRYYARFPRSLPTDPSYFPIGVWFESVLTHEEIDVDKRAGINLYVALTANSDLALIARNGMKVIAQQDDWLARADAPGSQAIAGWFVADEVDMQLNASDGVAKLRSLVDALPKSDGRLRYANYGKGVTFWNAETDAARYVNGFQDVVSADNYWFTDRQICSASQGGALLDTAGTQLKRTDCHLAANYGRTVERVRNLVRPKGGRPVWAFVEVGHPFSEAKWPSIEPAEVSAAVWSALIHGARGIVYFNHSFGGPHPTQHALREPAYARVREEVARTNARIRRLAPVLNAPFVDGFASTTGAVDTMTKRFGGKFYVFAASRAKKAQQITFQLPCAGHARVSVLDEERKLRVSGGSFEDSFETANTVHIYRIDSDSACWLPAG